MSCDSFHRQVERELKSKGKTHDFLDFVNCVENAYSTIPPVAVVMGHKDFFVPKINVTQASINKIRPRPYLNTFKHVSVTRGQFDFEYSSDINGDLTEKVNVFTKKQVKAVTRNFDLVKSLNFLSKPCGVEDEKKQSVIKNLLPLIPEQKKKFWEELPIKTP